MFVNQTLQVRAGIGRENRQNKKNSRLENYTRIYVQTSVSITPGQIQAVIYAEKSMHKSVLSCSEYKGSGCGHLNVEFARAQVVSLV